jgi:hypothetical protein
LLLQSEAVSKSTAGIMNVEGDGGGEGADSSDDDDEAPGKPTWFSELFRI